MLSPRQKDVFTRSRCCISGSSSGDPRSVGLDEYLSRLLEHIETSMHAEGHTASLRYDIAPLQLPTDAAINLGVVVSEWVTNAFKYAYPEHPGEVRVNLAAMPDVGASFASRTTESVGRPTPPRREQGSAPGSLPQWQRR
jgi:two-component sensor histidine kinase